MSSSTALSSSRGNLVSHSHVFALLLALRVSNALVLQTFFQPDEFYQSLEPAWQLVHGPDSGAWITWEWRNHLRSSLHPLLFAGSYRVAELVATWAQLSPTVSSTLWLAVPKATQAVFAACIDFFAWKCALNIYGRESTSAWTTLALCVLSPWQFFCSGRTLSNTLETALTAAALSVWFGPNTMTSSAPLKKRSRKSAKAEQGADISGIAISQLRYSLLLAAFAAILRPTNVLIWFPLGLELVLRCSSKVRLHIIVDALTIGLLVVLISSLADRWYYGTWTFPPLKFLYFNMAQDLAVFYGRNRWDYYFTEGLPLLLTTALPFAMRGMIAASARSQSWRSTEGSKIQSLVVTVVFTIICLSLISHKEVRFIYPLLPALHIIAARPVARFFMRKSALRLALLALLLLFNIAFATYVTQLHQRGVIDVIHHLRRGHEARMAAAGLYGPDVKTTVGFLMPCHSTPWRSHLVHQGIDAWALTCEPPLNVSLQERASYLDEADQFYANPIRWMRENMGDPNSANAIDGKRPWPEKVVFFEQLLPVISEYLGPTYKECWKTFNTHWHDDWRRKGDVIVWCRTWTHNDR